LYIAGEDHQSLFHSLEDGPWELTENEEVNAEDQGEL
jgi:hypothetical protein